MRVLELPRVETAKVVVDIGADSWLTYCVLRMLVDENDIISASVTDLAGLMKVSRQTIYNRLKKLESYRIDSVPLVRLEEVGGANLASSYRVMWDIKGAVTLKGVTLTSESSQLDTPSIKTDSVSLRDSNSAVKLPEVLRHGNDVLKYWGIRYKEHYGTDYEIVAWAREVGQAKNFLRKFGSARGKLIIDSIISNYDVLWKSPRFAKPTIGQAASWLGKQAEEYATKNADSADEAGNDAEPNLDELIKRGLL